MSKIIAVCGAPESGKTTFALKLAHSLNNKGKKKVLYVSFDLTIPALSYLFPNCKDSELYSIGKVLDNTDIYSLLYKTHIIVFWLCKHGVKNKWL